MIRKGVTLVEILAVVLVLPFAMLALDVLFTSMLSDIPRSNRLVQENTTLLNMLEQMHKDVSAARSLPKSYGKDTAGERLLLIELADGVVSYQFDGGKMRRRRLTLANQEEPADARVWSLPNSQVQWRVWRQHGRGCAVEVRAAIKYKLRSKYQDKMANSHVYFLGTS